MSILDPEFKAPFASEEELESAMDSLVITSQGPPGNSIEPSVVDENRLSQVEFVVRMLGFLTREDAAKITCETHVPTYDAYTVTVDTAELLFRSAWLSRCVALADQIQVFPNLDGGMKTIMIFHGVIRKETTV